MSGAGVRVATAADLPVLVAFSAQLNAHESIAITEDELAAGLGELLGDPRLGVVFVIEADGAPIGYALCAYAFDLEFSGREAWLTELFIADAARGRGAGAAALEAIGDDLRARGVHALHLQVRPENPAIRLYERLGFARVPRLVMSRRL